jgi:hypothetical protein
MPKENRSPYYHSVGPFLCDGEEQLVEVLDSRQTVQRSVGPSRIPVETTICPEKTSGCVIENMIASPKGHWIVTCRGSGEGDWGYDVFRVKPLSREAGIIDEGGYMLECPKFWPDESRIVGGGGEGFLSEWWMHADDVCYSAARGGPVTMGFIFIHHLPSHEITRYPLCCDLPKGWIPDDVDCPVWYRPMTIGPTTHGISMVLSWGVTVDLEEPLPAEIWLATPHPSGRALLKV